MYKYKRNGFTLVELMAVIIIISLIALLTFPNIINQIKKTKKSNNKMIEDVVIEQAKKYVSDNEEEFQDEKYCFSIDSLVDKDYVKDSLFKNNNFLDKKVIYITNSNEDDYNYKIMDKDKCSIYDFVDNDGNGYNTVEYLESTGTQYIDTGISLKLITKLDAEFSATRHPSSDSIWINGWVATDYDQTFEWGVVNNQWIVSVGINTGLTYLNIPFDTNKHNVHLESGSQKFDNVEYATKTIKSDVESTQTIYLFALKAEWSNQVLRTFPERIYSAKIYDGDNLVRDFIPVLDKNKRPCLFDKIDKRCYYNKGTDEFHYPKKDNNYKIVNYLKSTGAQYINTNYKPNQNTIVKTGFKVLKSETEFYFGSRTTTHSEMFLLLQSQNKFRSDFANYQEPIYNSNYITMNNIEGYPNFVIIKDKNVTNINNSFTSTVNYADFQSPYEMYIFALNTAGDLTGTSEIELYYFKIYEGDVLKRDYIPVLDSNGVACLYDKVEDKFYYNQGTGDFLYG